MALDGLNAAAAAAILNQAGVDQATKTRGVIVSAFVPGPLGLAVPIILARNAKPSYRGPRGGRVAVPDVSNGGLSFDDASRLLESRRLRVVREEAFGDEEGKGTVIDQRPAAKTLVALDSTVTVTINAGAAPPEETASDVDTVAELDEDLTNKISRAAMDSTRAITDRLDRMQRELTTVISNSSTNSGDVTA